MKRILYQQLVAWKNSVRRKPLLLQGARQVGKTYLVTEFGNAEYDQFIYLNFEQNEALIQLFEGELDPHKIVNKISLYIGKKIVAENTLLFFDEIQAAPKVLTSLKYFNEQAPEFHIIAAGSLLGVSIGKETGFPVGKVNFLTLYPLSYIEYLMATDETLLAEELLKKDEPEAYPDIIHTKLLEHLKMYFFLGGMPEVVKNYIQHKDIALARIIQNEILEAYRRDFSKYADSSLALKTAEIWNTIPYTLAKENKKFKYSDLAKNARAVNYQASIEWLTGAGLIYKAMHISTPKLPLSGYVETEKFKIYMLDTGLLGAMLKLDSAIIIEPNALFSEYNSAFTENYIATQLIANQAQELYYWTSKYDAEVDFIVEKSNQIYPVEVKSGMSKNKKSLQSYIEKYSPVLAFRLSPRNYIKQENFVNVPLYGVNKIL